MWFGIAINKWSRNDFSDVSKNQWLELYPYVLVKIKTSNVGFENDEMKR